MRRPAILASTLRRESAAGIAALVGRPMPSASTIDAIVDAVPIVMQWPAERDMQDSTSTMSAGVASPVFSISVNFHTCVPEPMSSPRYLPLSIGPPETPMVGRSHDAAPISSAGVVLSQPISSTTPSNGLARIDSSTSIDVWLRKSIVVGRISVSPRLITGNSIGKPPSSHTPRLTWSARSRKCALHGVASDHVLQMPITGRPSNWSCGMPWFFIHDRWVIASRSWRPNHSMERRTRFFLADCLLIGSDSIEGYQCGTGCGTRSSSPTLS